MPVSFASAGYGGAVTQESWAKLASELGHEYSVLDEGSWAVTAATGDRAIAIAPGVGYGHGVHDETTAAESLFIPAVTTGSVRYDLIVARRDWTTKATTFEIVAGGVTKAIPSRSTGPGFLDEQPIALVKVTVDSASITEITDLRVWATGGGVFAKDDLVRSYLDKIGTQVIVGSSAWSLQISAGTSGVATWVKRGEIGKIPLFGVGNSRVGGVPASGSQFLVQTGTSVSNADGAGYGRITFPLPFPNGVMFASAVDGDQSIDAARGSMISMPNAGAPDWTNAVQADSFVYAVQNYAAVKLPGALHRADWIAIGW